MTSSHGSSISSAINRLVYLQLEAHFAYRYLGELCSGKTLKFEMDYLQGVPSPRGPGLG